MPETDTSGDPFAWVDAPTDSESGDAQHNSDVWELRDRVTKLRAALAARDAEHADEITLLRATFESGTITLGIGPEGCQPGEWDCEEYQDADGYRDPAVELCGHIEDDVWTADRLVGLIEKADALGAEVTRLSSMHDDAERRVDARDAEVCTLTRDLEAEVGSRERLEALCDELAARIAPPEVLGEHSNLNDPWRNALEYTDPRDAELASQRDMLQRLRANSDRVCAWFWANDPAALKDDGPTDAVLKKLAAQDAELRHVQEVVGSVASELCEVLPDDTDRIIGDTVLSTIHRVVDELNAVVS